MNDLERITAEINSVFIQLEEHEIDLEGARIRIIDAIYGGDEI